MLLHPTLEKLTTLRFTGMATALDEQMQKGGQIFAYLLPMTESQNHSMSTLRIKCLNARYHVICWKN
jgi:hypothetical protein